MSSASLVALVAHARSVDAADRARFAKAARATLPAGAILLETCHRVELYGAEADLLRPSSASSVDCLDGDAVARHLVAVAVGLESAVVAEDQVLHQLRAAVDDARTRARLAPDLDRLADVALHAGRRARSWLPARRPSLADLAIGRIADTLAGRRVLVVGAGEMGRLAAAAAAARGADVRVASRTRERAADVAARLGAQAVALDPGAAAVETLDGIVVALRGPWDVSPATIAAIAAAAPVIVDLSAPPATPPAIRERLGRRFTSIDDLATDDGGALTDGLIGRLRQLAEATVADYVAWRRREPVRRTARDLGRRAEEARASELTDLWRRLPDLEAAEREEIDRMARHLAERLLREPLERLGRDADGTHERAARELFGL